MVAGISSVTEAVSFNEDWPYGDNREPTVNTAFLSDTIKSTHIGAEVRGKPRKVIPGADSVQAEKIGCIWNSRA